MIDYSELHASVSSEVLVLHGSLQSMSSVLMIRRRDSLYLICHSHNMIRLISISDFDKLTVGIVDCGAYIWQ